MNRFLSASLLLSLCLIASACSKNDPGEALPTSVEVTGILQKTEHITTYQYGHYFINTYALRSTTIDLEEFVGQRVRVVGSPIEGYPLEGGPEYLEVSQVEAL